MESSQEQLDRIGMAIRQTLSMESAGADPLRWGRQRLVETVALRNCTGTSGRSRLSLVWRGLAGLGLVVAAALALVMSRRPITFDVEGGALPARTGEVIQASDDFPLALVFSEGSAIVLHEGSRMRVLSVQKDGARVLVESGALDATIRRPSRPAHWQFDLGPFRVLLAGSKFHAAWDPANERLSMSVREGSVVVAGRCVRGQRTVRAGQRLDLLCPPEPSMPAAPRPTASVAGEPTRSPGAWQRRPGS